MKSLSLALFAITLSFIYNIYSTNQKAMEIQTLASEISNSNREYNRMFVEIHNKMELNTMELARLTNEMKTLCK